MTKSTKALKDAIKENLTDDEKSKLITYAAIVHSWYDNDEKTALEICGGVPAFLAELVSNLLGDCQVEMGDTDINFNQHFFGFMQLYTSQSGSSATAEYVVVFPVGVYVCPLAQYNRYHRPGRTCVWFMEGKGRPWAHVWLRDFLFKDLPCCRTMIYLY